MTTTWTVWIVLAALLTALDAAPIPKTYGKTNGKQDFGKGMKGKGEGKAVSVPLKGGGKVKRCSFRPFIAGGGTVAIWAKDLKLASHWTRAKYSGGMTWRVDGGLGIDKPGSGAICTKFSPGKPGMYAFSLVSSAPHAHDHNDAWVKLGTEVTLYRPKGNSTVAGDRGTWYKAFQNEGAGKVAHYALTKDNDGHQFVAGPLKDGHSYSVCVAGRSSRFTILKLVFVRCPGDSIAACNRDTPFMKRAMNWLPPSPCL